MDVRDEVRAFDSVMAGAAPVEAAPFAEEAAPDGREPDWLLMASTSALLRIPVVPLMPRLVASVFELGEQHRVEATCLLAAGCGTRVRARQGWWLRRFLSREVLPTSRAHSDMRTEVEVNVLLRSSGVMGLLPATEIKKERIPERRCRSAGEDRLL
ncbi:MAG: hypothetical protein WKF73_21795 [Nocardioidaceae bacterium]